MPRLIFKCPYIRGGSQRAAAHLGNYVRYMATREGAQRIPEQTAQLPATEKQRQMVERLLRDFPLSRDTFEYEDYQTSPTRGNASEFISRALEDNYDRAAKKENYVQYIAGRPRAQRRGSHALFTGSDESLTLSQVAEEIAHHPGNVWLPIISLRREDAARLGYDDAEQWKSLLTGYAMEMAQAMKIPWDQFRWYAAFHDEGHHPHVHMVCYSADGKSGYLTKEGIAQIKSGLAQEIFRNELTELYRQQTQRRDDLTQRASQVMEGLVQQMEAGTLDNPRLERLMEHLAEKLKNMSGKKQYGYLKAPLKSVVDEIVDELARDPRVAQAYDLWYELREEVLRTYKNDLPERLPLSQQKEFKQIKNMVIQEAVRLGEITELFAPDDLADEPDFVETGADGATVGPKAAEHASSPGRSTDEPPHATKLWSARYRQACRLRYGPGRTGRDLRWALSLFQKEAAADNPLAMYELGRMYAEGLGCIRNKKIAREWYAKALDDLRKLESAAPDHRIQYRIGTMYAIGLGTRRAPDLAAQWFTRAAESGDVRAMYALGKLLICSPKQDLAGGLRWLTAAAEQGNQYAQYTLGKLYLLGQGAPQDKEAAQKWLSQAAAQGNQQARYVQEHIHEFHRPPLAASVVRLLHHMAGIFREQEPHLAAGPIRFTDKKLRRKIQAKKIAMGHKPDDHETPTMNL